MSSTSSRSSERNETEVTGEVPDQPETLLSLPLKIDPNDSPHDIARKLDEARDFLYRQ